MNRPSASISPTGLASSRPPRRTRRLAHARQAHPLLGAFPLAVITLGTLMVLFAVMMAQFSADADSSSHADTVTALVARARAGAP